MKDINKKEIIAGCFIRCKIKNGQTNINAAGFVFDTNGGMGDGMLVLAATHENGSTSHTAVVDCMDVEVIDIYQKTNNLKKIEERLKKLEFKATHTIHGHPIDEIES